jgi:hypothetical protein
LLILPRLSRNVLADGLARFLTNNNFGPAL